MDPNINHFQPPLTNQSAEQYLESVEEQWNKRIDVEMKVMGEGLESLIQDYQSILSPTHSLSSSSHLSSNLHLSSILRSSQNLIALTNQLKLSVLLNDEQGKKETMDAEGERLRLARERLRAEVEKGLSDVASGREEEKTV